MLDEELTIVDCFGYLGGCVTKGSGTVVKTTRHIFKAQTEYTRLCWAFGQIFHLGCKFACTVPQCAHFCVFARCGVRTVKVCIPWRFLITDVCLVSGLVGVTG